METWVIVLVVVLGLISFSQMIAIRQKKEELKNTKKKYRKLKEENEKLKEENTKLVKENDRFIMQPHSMKNSLNSIDGMIKKTMKSVENLTHILDYMLYDADEDFVPLKDEINFIKNIYDLHLSPLKSTIKQSFRINIPDDVQNQKKVSPKIFINFIENAFKHGNRSDPDFMISVKINLINDDTIEYIVENSFDEKKEKEKGGKGNTHFKRTLNRIYKDIFELEEPVISNGIYKTELKLKLK
jgi:sensor histidine kinase YesM